MADQPTDLDDPNEWVTWWCPRCGKYEGEDIKVRAHFVIYCTCGHASRSS